MKTYDKDLMANMRQVSKEQFFQFLNPKDVCYGVVSGYDEDRGYTGHYKLRNGQLLGINDGIEYKNNQRYFVREN